jgi:putative glutamine amidotransferase
MFYPVVIDEDNGSVEAFVSPTMNIMAFQWHPERIFETEEGRLFSRHMIQDFLGMPRNDE